MGKVDEARFGRVCLLVLNICPFTLRQVISDYYKRHRSLSIQDFLETNKHELFHLLKKRCCCRSQQSKTTPLNKSQWDSLYMRNSSSCRRGQRGDCPCQYNVKRGITTSVMDVTLCCLFIQNICPGITINMAHVDTIREVRNNLIHSGSASLDEPSFLHYWNRVENAIINVALHVSPTLHLDTTKMVKDLEDQLINMAELAEELKRLLVDEERIDDHEERIDDHEERIDDHEERIDDLEKNVGDITKLTVNLTQKVTHLESNMQQATQKVTQNEGCMNQTTRKATHNEGRVKQKSQKVTQIEGGLNPKTQKVTNIEDLNNQTPRKTTHIKDRMNKTTQNVTQIQGRMNKTTQKVKRTGTEGRMNKTTQKFKNSEGQVTQKTQKMTHTEGHMNKRTQKVTRFQGRMNKTSQKVTQNEYRMNKTTQKITQNKDRMNKTTQKVTQNEDCMNKTIQKVTNIEARVNQTTQMMTQIEGHVNETAMKTTHIEDRVNQTTQKMTQLEESVHHGIQENRRNISLVESAVVDESREIRGIQQDELGPIQEELLEHNRQLDKHGRQIDDHGRQIDDNGRQIDDNGRRLDEQSRQIQTQETEFKQETADIKLHIPTCKSPLKLVSAAFLDTRRCSGDKNTQKKQNFEKRSEWRVFFEGYCRRKKKIRLRDQRATPMIMETKFSAPDMHVADNEIMAKTNKEPNISKLKQKLIQINGDKAKVIPISPLQERGEDEMPIELLYASVIIREDPKYIEKGRNSSQPTTYLIDPSKSYYGNEFDSDTNTSESSFVCDSDTYECSSDYDRDDTGSVTHSQHDRGVTDPADIFIKDDSLVENIYILGDAAHGKTTYCIWLLKKWCDAQLADGEGSKELDEWEKLLKRFDFVFLLQFRNVSPSRVSVIDMICQDVFRKKEDFHATIRLVLSSDEYRCLIIMDGLDEWKPNEKTKKQLTFKGMPNIEGMASSVSCVISMRPWVFPTILKMVKVSDRVIEIHGLSGTGMKKVIQNVLLYHYKLKDDPSKYRATYNKIVRHLEEKSLKSFMKIPLLAVICVQIWYKGKQVGDSMTSFYAVMLNMLLEIADQKHELHIKRSKTGDCELPEILSENGYIEKFFSVLLKLGKVAYKGLLSKETILVFQKRKLEREIGKRELQFALDVGLISQKEAPSTTTKNVSVHFFHKSIQEFLAVIYIVTQKEVSDLFCKHLSNVDVIMELSNVIMFICGMCPSLGSVISQRVVSVTDSDTEICQYRESLGCRGRVKELYKLQISWYRELHYGQTDSPVPQTDSPVPQTYSPVTQTDSPVTQIDKPMAEIDRPVTQTYSPETQTDSPVTFHVSDVYQFHSDTQTVGVTRELLSDHHVDIRSLSLEWVPTDGECGITYTVLDDFLSNTHRTRSLVMLYINGRYTNRSVPTLCVPTLRCLHLHDITINTHLCGNVCPPLLTDMSQLRVLELCNVTLGEGGLSLSPDMVHIERVQLMNVNMPAAGWGEFVRSVSHIRHRFYVVLCDTNIDDVSFSKIRSSPDFTVTGDSVVNGRYELHFTRVWPSSQHTQDDELMYTRV